MSEQPATTSDVIRLADYAPPPFRITTIALRVELGEDSADVRSDLTVERHPDATDRSDELRLDGHDMALVGIALDGNPLGPERYRRDDEGLTVIGVPDNFRLSVHTRIEPQNNTALEGLYRSGEMFCTQCEAEGFRRITYYQDRPDILATYTTTIVADKRRYPILLSNGNPIDQGEDGHLHWVTWEDPYPKPSYLFALVAGNLACYQDSFRTASGRDVDLRIYVEPHNHDKCEHAMQSLIKSMRWDEEVYGLEYDLDIY
ncbi:MAG: aminopeptidase N, partial [Pseudomonadota bacterium]